VKQDKAPVSYSRYLAAAFAIAILLACPGWLSHAQQKNAPKAPPPPPPKPAPQNNPFGQFGEELKQKAAGTTITTLLNNDLPLKLDANAVFPIVNVLPGGPFHPKHLQLIAEDMDKPLPPGDYTINTLAFCTEYSVHRPGAGVGYVLGPLQGKAAGAIGALLWRGTIEKGKPPQQLQAVSWAIQSGLMYSQMPKTYQAVIDDVIPDHKNELNGDFFQSMEESYTNLAKGTKLPPLQQMLASMGKSGQLALSADRQRQALLRQNTSDQIKEQTLFAGQDQGVYTPVRVEEGPWTERIPGRVYMRVQIFGGNMAANNLMQIRILPAARTTAREIDRPQPLFVNFSAPAFARPRPADLNSTLTSIRDLFQNIIGYALGAGAQALAQLPVQTQPPCTTNYVSPDDPFNPWRPPPCPGSANQTTAAKPPANPAGPAVATVSEIRGTATANDKPLNVGDTITSNEVIKTGADSHVSLMFGDTTVDVAPSTTFDVGDFTVHEPPSLLQGAFLYLSGLIGKKQNADVHIETPVGTIGIRGTEFIAKYDEHAGRVEVNLIHGAVDVSPKRTKTAAAFNAPVTILFDEANARTAPLTQVQYDAVNARLFSSQGPGVPVL
jgi:hypothetical protein